MEWVETTGKTIEEAKDRALDLLGVDERDAEFEVLEEPKVGFLGRVKGAARVRGRIRPTAPRAKTDRRDRRRRGGENRGRSDRETRDNRDNNRSRRDQGSGAVVAPESEGEPEGASVLAADRAPSSRRRRKRGRGGAGVNSSPASSGTEPPAGPAAVVESGGDESSNQPKVAAMPDLSLEDQARIVSLFLDGLVDAFGLTATTSWEETDEENVEVRVDGPNLGLLVGPKGRTLLAVTDVARAVVVRHGEGGSPGRVHVDVAGYRQRRREALGRFTAEIADEVRASGVARALEPMSAADRKVVHDAVNELAGVQSTSEGEDPYRRVVILPD